jgi:hypothetical protein
MVRNIGNIFLSIVEKLIKNAFVSIVLRNAMEKCIISKNLFSNNLGQLCREMYHLYVYTFLSLVQRDLINKCITTALLSMAPGIHTYHFKSDYLHEMCE